MKKLLLLITLISLKTIALSQIQSAKSNTVITNRTLVGFNGMNTIQNSQDWKNIAVNTDFMGYTLNCGDIATIEITDAVGIKNKQLSLAVNSFETSYSFVNTSNGIYTCNLICNNKIISTCKLVIIK